MSMEAAGRRTRRLTRSTIVSRDACTFTKGRGQHSRRWRTRPPGRRARPLRLRRRVTALAVAHRRPTRRRGCLRRSSCRGRDSPGTRRADAQHAPRHTADWRKVFREAAARDVAIEIDGNWHRQDVDYELAVIAGGRMPARARQRRAQHREFPFTDYAIAHARTYRRRPGRSRRQLLGGGEVRGLVARAAAA